MFCQTFIKVCLSIPTNKYKALIFPPRFVAKEDCKAREGSFSGIVDVIPMLVLWWVCFMIMECHSGPGFTAVYLRVRLYIMVHGINGLEIELISHRSQEIKKHWKITILLNFDSWQFMTLWPSRGTRRAKGTVSICCIVFLVDSRFSITKQWSSPRRKYHEKRAEERFEQELELIQVCFTSSL